MSETVGSRRKPKYKKALNPPPDLVSSYQLSIKNHNTSKSRNRITRIKLLQLELEMADIDTTSEPDSIASFGTTPESTIGELPMLPPPETLDDFDTDETMMASPGDYQNTSPMSPGVPTANNGTQATCKAAGTDHTTECSGFDDKEITCKGLDFSILNFAISGLMMVAFFPTIYFELPLLLASPWTVELGECFRIAQVCLLLGFSVNTFTCKIGELGNWLVKNVKKKILAQEILHQETENLLLWLHTPITISRSVVILANLIIGWLLLSPFCLWVTNVTGIPEVFVQSIWKRIETMGELLGAFCVVGLCKHVDAHIRKPRNLALEKSPTPDSSTEGTGNLCKNDPEPSTHVQSSHAYLKWLHGETVATPWDILKLVIITIVSMLPFILRGKYDASSCQNTTGRARLSCFATLNNHRDEAWVFGLLGLATYLYLGVRCLSAPRYWMPSCMKL